MHAVYRVAAGNGAEFIVKLLPVEAGLDPEAIVLATARAAGSQLVIPSEYGTTGDGAQAYEIQRFFGGGNLADWLATQRAVATTATRQRIVRRLVEDLLPVLRSFEPQTASPVQLVHGDIKPTNILVEGDTLDSLRFWLADLEALRILDSARPPRVTPRYAAPEGQSSSSDYWSLGMVCLECLLGEHPLRNLDNAAVLRLIRGSWNPRADVRRVLRAEDRALIGGLVERNHETRWRPQELQRWLDEDSEIIREGLARCSEIRAREPYVIKGESCRTALDLARALIESGEAEHLGRPELRNWLIEQIQGGDIVARLDALNSDQNLNPHMRLLEFCFSITGDARALWQGRRISRADIDAEARTIIVSDETAGETATDGRAALEWLESLLDGECERFFLDKLRRTSRLLEKLSHAVTSYSEAWTVAVQSGAPEHARPERAEMLAEALRAACSLPLRRALLEYRRELAEMPFLVLLDAWMRAFGTDLSQLTIAQLLVFRRLNPLGRQDALSGRIVLDGYVGDEPSRQLVGHSEPIIWQNTQRQLMRGLVPVAGAQVEEVQEGRRVCGGRQTPYQLDLATDLASFRRWLSGLRRRWLLPRQPVGNTTLASDDALQRRTPSIHIRMLRVSEPLAASLGLDYAGTEYYMAIVRWDSARQPNTFLRIRRAGLWVTETRLRSPRLPDRGYYAMVLHGRCEIFLERGHAIVEVFGGIPLWSERLTASIIVWLPDQAPTLETSRASIQEPLHLAASQTRLVPAAGRVIAPETTLREAGSVKSVALGLFGTLVPGFWRRRLKPGFDAARTDVARQTG